jgi:predicted SprT family Zn-dependent metalloprotease
MIFPLYYILGYLTTFTHIKFKGKPMKFSLRWTHKFYDNNDRYFNGNLEPVAVYIVPKKDMHGNYGMYFPKDNIRPAVIFISREMSDHQKQNILLHEMCHHYVDTDERLEEYHHHGTNWKTAMKACGFKGEITRYSGRFKNAERH